MYRPKHYKVNEIEKLGDDDLLTEEFKENEQQGALKPFRAEIGFTITKLSSVRLLEMIRRLKNSIEKLEGAVNKSEQTTSRYSMILIELTKKLVKLTRWLIFFTLLIAVLTYILVKYK